MQTKILASAKKLDGIKDSIIKYFCESGINLTYYGLKDTSAENISNIELEPSECGKYRLKCKNNYINSFIVEFKYKQHGERYFFKRIYE